MIDELMFQVSNQAVRVFHVQIAITAASSSAVSRWLNQRARTSSPNIATAVRKCISARRKR